MAIGTEEDTSRAVSAAQPGTMRQRAKRQRRACIECHQAKLRCDAPVLPCSRCRRLGLACRVDQDYRRMSKNDKIKNLEREVNQLRANNNGPLVAEEDAAAVGAASVSTSQLDSQDVAIGAIMPSPGWPAGFDQSMPTPQRSQIGDEPSNSQNDMRSPQLSVAVAAHDEQALHQGSDEITTFSPPFIARVAATAARSIGSVQLSGDQIDWLFEQYFARFHPYLDVLGDRIAPDQCHAESPLLFWTIVSISGRRFPDDASLLPSLSPVLTTLLWSTISIRPHSWHTVGSIVLHVAWPLPASTPFVENSYILSGVAMQAAMQLGLHQPEIIQDFSRTKTTLSADEIGRQARIWAACNIVSQSTTTLLGYPPVTPFHWTVHRCCVPGSIYSPSSSLRHRLLIERFTHRVTSVLGSGQPPSSPEEAESQSDLSPLIHMLEQEWEEINAQYQREMSAYNRIFLTGARLHLLLHSFFQPLNLPSRREGLLKAFITATGIISQVEVENESSRMLLYAPAVVYNLLVLACFTIMKLLNSSLSDDLDGEGGKRSFNRAISALREASVVNNDGPGRSTEILARLWRGVGHSPTSQSLPSLRIRSRGSASVQHDEVWRYREEFFAGQQNAYPLRASVGTSTSRPSRAGSAQPMGGLDAIEMDLFANIPWTWEFDVQP